MNVLLLGCVYSENQKSRFLKSSKRGYQFAAQNFQEAIIDGFCANGVSISVLTIPSLSTFPLGNRLPIVTKHPFVYKGAVMGTSLGYINLPFFNKPCMSAISNAVEEWYRTCKGKKYVLVYALLPMQMTIAVNIKKRHPEVELGIIVPDLPRFMSCNKYYQKLGLQEKNNNLIYSLVGYFNYYILLSDAMKVDLKIPEDKYIILEGVFQQKKTAQDKPIIKRKSILYSGGISVRYGVFDLIEAFHLIPDSDIELWLCGRSDNTDMLRDEIKRDSRIKYMGVVSHEKSLELQQQAMLLVNPRHSTELFTKYSFPSKTLEYMASGTPVLMNHLPSIPQEYLSYIYLFQEESIEGYAKKIQEILNKDRLELDEFGRQASSFILTEKNAKVQIKRVISLFSKE